MGNTSVNTACSPRFFLREGGWSACKNSRYELVCNSIRFGGAIISLILPKLIRSVARDGIWDLYKWLATAPDRWLLLKRRKARTPRSRANLPELKPPTVVSLIFSILI